MKCDKCHQDLPEPVYVGPGDEVMIASDSVLRPRQTVLASPVPGWITTYGIGSYSGLPVTTTRELKSLRTLDGRPIAGFRDPAQEDLHKARRRIVELEELLAEWRAEFRHTHDTLTREIEQRDERIKELEAEKDSAITDLFSRDQRLEFLGHQHADLRNLYDLRCKEVRDLLKSTNPLAGLTDEQIRDMAKETFREWTFSSNDDYEDDVTAFLCDIRDGKLGVPK